MTDTFAPSAKPPYAMTFWADDNAVFVEIPCLDGAPPYVLRYPFSEAGLSKALHLMRSAYEATKPKAPANYTRHPKVRRVAYTPMAGFTEPQRSAVHGVLVGMGLLGKDD